MREFGGFALQEIVRLGFHLCSAHLVLEFGLLIETLFPEINDLFVQCCLIVFIVIAQILEGTLVLALQENGWPLV